VSLWLELKRRKVVRVAVVYAATAFAVLQAADIMLEQMNVPEWGMGLVVALGPLFVQFLGIHNHLHPGRRK